MYDKDEDKLDDEPKKSETSKDDKSKNKKKSRKIIRQTLDKKKIFQIFQFQFLFYLI